MVFYRMLKKLTALLLKNKHVLLIITGILIWSLTMVRSGLKYGFGIGFWGPNGHDGVWHIALSESLSRFSFQNPVFAGEYLKNYHLGFDLFLAFFHKVTTIPINFLYFQLFPVIFSFLIGFLVYKLVFYWKKSSNLAFWSVFFVYFSTGFGFLMTLVKDRTIDGESMFWSQQAVSTLVNPPYALSLIFILLGILFLFRKNYFLSVLSFGILIQIKAYSAIIILAGLFFAGFYSLIIDRNFNIIKVFLGSLVINVFLFFAVRNDSVSVFSIQPFWFLETMMSYSDRFNWPNFYSAMTNYKIGGVWVKAFLAYFVAFLIFIIGNLGTRLFSLVYLIKLVKRKIKIGYLDILILTIILTGIVLPMFLVQKGTPWNTIQFFYYSQFFLSILAGISFANILKTGKRLLKYVLILFLFLFFSLGVFSTLKHYLPKMPQSMISNEEVEALEFLRKEPSGIVLTYPFDTEKSKKALLDPPRPLYFYDSTAYVSAFGKKDVFLEDEVNLNIMGYDWKERREELLWFISNLNIEDGKNFLAENNIKYLYLVKENSPLFGEYLRLGADDLNLKKIFENGEVIILRYE